MKGIYIWEDYFRKDITHCANLKELDHAFTTRIDLGEEVNVHGLVDGVRSARCSEKDEYDFEVGAVISLMRMCGKTAVDKAYEEVYGPRPASIVVKLKRAQLHIMSLRKEVETLMEANKTLYEKAVDCDKYREALKQAYKDISEGTDALEELNDKYDKVVEALKKAKDLDEHRVEEIKELKKRLNSMYGTKRFDTSFGNGNLKLDTCTFGPSKRVKFWKDIKSEKIQAVKVRREDIEDFLDSAEAWDIYWQNGAKVTAWNNWNEWRKYEALLFSIKNGEELSWLDYDKNYTACQVDFTNYIPHGTAKMFKRGKFNIAVDAKDVHGFVEWCKAWELIPKDETLDVQFKRCPVRYPDLWCYYDKEKKTVMVSQTELNNGKPTYDWKDL